MMAPEQAFELFHRQAEAFRRIPVATYAEADPRRLAERHRERGRED